jgi:hypothetical protein
MLPGLQISGAVVKLRTTREDAGEVLGSVFDYLRCFSTSANALAASLASNRGVFWRAPGGFAFVVGGKDLLRYEQKKNNTLPRRFCTFKL